MTKTCLLCRIEYSPFATQSFHKFPADENIRKKWLSALNLSKTPNFKTAVICSDHFDLKDFNDSDYQRKRQRLNSQAVPRYINLKLCDKQIDNECDKQHLFIVNNFTEVDCIEENIESLINENVNQVKEELSDHANDQFVIYESSHHDHDYYINANRSMSPNVANSYNEKNLENQSPASTNDLNEESMDFDDSNLHCHNDQSSNVTVDNERTKNPLQCNTLKKTRIHNGKCNTVISRRDFTTDYAYNSVITYINNIRKKNKLYQRQYKRFQNKYYKLKTEIDKKLLDGVK